MLLRVTNAKKQALLQRALERKKFRKPSVPVHEPSVHSSRSNTELAGHDETGAAEAEAVETAVAEVTGDPIGLIAELSSTEILRHYGGSTFLSPRGYEAGT